MIRKEKIIEAENALLARVYDLILNPETTDEERSMLVEFKNTVENRDNFQNATMKLAKSLRILALKKYNNKENLSKEVGKLYMDISTTGFLEANFGYGTIVLSGVLGAH